MAESKSCAGGGLLLLTGLVEIASTAALTLVGERESSHVHVVFFIGFLLSCAVHLPLVVYNFSRTRVQRVTRAALVAAMFTLIPLISASFFLNLHCCVKHSCISPIVWRSATFFNWNVQHGSNDSRLHFYVTRSLHETTAPSGSKSPTDTSEFVTEEIAYADRDGSIDDLAQFGELEALWATPDRVYFTTPEDPLPEDVMTIYVDRIFGLQVFQLSKSDKADAVWEWRRLASSYDLLRSQSSTSIERRTGEKIAELVRLGTNYGRFTFFFNDCSAIGFFPYRKWDGDGEPSAVDEVLLFHVAERRFEFLPLIADEDEGYPLYLPSMSCSVHLGYLHLMGGIEQFPDEVRGTMEFKNEDPFVMSSAVWRLNLLSLKWGKLSGQCPALTAPHGGSAVVCQSKLHVLGGKRGPRDRVDHSCFVQSLLISVEPLKRLAMHALAKIIAAAEGNDNELDDISAEECRNFIKTAKRLFTMS